MDNETWLIEDGDKIIKKKVRFGVDHFTDWEWLVYSLWVADYGMRNAGDLETARDLFADFQAVAIEAAKKMSLPVASSAFSLEPDELETQYFDLFEAVCTEIRLAQPGASTLGQ